MNENLMQTEVDIMKNLNLHLNENKKVKSRKQSIEPPIKQVNFKKQRTSSESKGSNFHFNLQKKKFKMKSKPENFNNPPQTKYFSKVSNRASIDENPPPLPGLKKKEILKESHFFDMIDQMQKQTRRLASQKDLLNQQSERNWFESITEKKQF